MYEKEPLYYLTDIKRKEREFSMRVFITGCNGGIGRALIKRYALEGYNIVANVHHITADMNDYASRIAAEYSVEIELIEFDVTDEMAIKDYVRELNKRKITIDVLVNNAGIAHGGLLQMTSIATVKKVFDVNYFGVVMMCQYVSRLMMREKKGSIINIASVAGIDADEGNVAYGASKAAVIAFTKSIAKELVKYNIRVNAVAPGLTDTEMAKQMERKAENQMIQNSSFKRLAKPEEIANAVFFLTSDNASFITGQVLRVDGGM